MEEFKPGDVVRLKSGGPPMTCEKGANEDGLVTCEWFDKNDRIEGSRLSLPSWFGASATRNRPLPRQAGTAPACGREAANGARVRDVLKPALGRLRP
jgi:uncharacterized protein YodC (DUF2158 family)